MVNHGATLDSESQPVPAEDDRAFESLHLEVRLKVKNVPSFIGMLASNTFHRHFVLLELATESCHIWSVCGVFPQSPDSQLRVVFVVDNISARRVTKLDPSIVWFERGDWKIDKFASGCTLQRSNAAQAQRLYCSGSADLSVGNWRKHRDV